MIGVRHPDGRVARAPQGSAVELLDEHGRLIMVLITTHLGLKCATTGDPEFNAYARQYRLTASNVVVHEPTPRTLTAK